MNNKKLKQQIDETLDELMLASSLCKTLTSVIENDIGNLRKIDKIYLSMALDKFLDKQKFEWGEIRKKLYGLY